MFQIRSYEKAELAMLYCPKSSPENAVKNLGRWIKRCHPLQDELRDKLYNPRCHTFFRSEVEIIVKYLGEP